MIRKFSIIDFTLVHVFANRSMQQMALARLIFDGAMEAHPGLRFGFLEAGAGWLPDFLHALHEVSIRLAEILNQHQHADVLQQAGDKSFITRQLPDRLGDFTSSDCLDRRASPIPLQRFDFQTREQFLRQAEPQYQQPQRLGAQQR